MMRPWLFAAALCAAVAAAHDTELSLAVGDTLTHTATLPETVTVHVAGLRRGGAYEARVSYLGSPPVQYTVEVRRPAAPAARKLLDTEKLIFTASDGIAIALPDGATAVDVVLGVKALGVVRAGEGGRWDRASFAFTVEELYFGAVPWGVLQLVAMVIVALAVGRLLIVPRLVAAVAAASDSKRH
jgi:hypothetical protein